VIYLVAFVQPWSPDLRIWLSDYPSIAHKLSLIALDCSGQRWTAWTITRSNAFSVQSKLTGTKGQIMISLPLLGIPKQSQSYPCVLVAMSELEVRTKGLKQQNSTFHALSLWLRDQITAVCSLFVTVQSACKHSDMGGLSLRLGQQWGEIHRGHMDR